MIKLDGIDIKTKGYIVAPPSKHASGKQYEWINSMKEMIDLPENLRQVLCRKEKILSLDETTKFIKSSRNNSLTSIAGSLRNKNIGRSEIERCLKIINQSYCKPPLPQDELERIAKSVSRYQTDENIFFDSMENVVQKDIEFLIDPYLPKGSLSIIDGDPGVGKSYLTTHLAAAVTLGRQWAGLEIEKPQNVLFMSVEDDADRVLLPRLSKHKANVSMIDYMAKAFYLNQDGADRLGRKLSKKKYGLVIIDPVTAFLPSEADMYRANEVRGFLMPLAEIAREYNTAILLIRHLRKADTDNAIHRGIGSIDFMATVRSAMIFSKSPDNPHERLLAHAKASYTALGKTQSFLMSGGEGGRIARLKWNGENEISADALLKAQNQKPQKIESAKEFLMQILENGPVPSSVVKKNAEARGFSETTMKRARKELGTIAGSGRDAELRLP